MNRYNFIAFLICMFITGCGSHNIKKESPAATIAAKKHSNRKILIQPLDDIGENVIAFLDSNIARYYKATISVLPARRIPASAWYAPRHRFRADKILAFLRTFARAADTYVIGVTGKDISTSNGANPDWGVMGLGYQPGSCCVVSDYRLNKYPQSEWELHSKLLKVAIHELGHNFGLPHCPNEQCLMTDAKGKDRLNHEKDFCPKCAAYLHSGGFLK
ncbi:MAG: matrixin family metalloprotease [Chitinophagaceae bacterium]